MRGRLLRVAATLGVVATLYAVPAGAAPPQTFNPLPPGLLHRPMGPAFQADRGLGPPGRSGPERRARPGSPPGSRRRSTARPAVLLLPPTAPWFRSRSRRWGCPPTTDCPRAQHVATRPDAKSTWSLKYRSRGVDTGEIVICGGSHLDFSLIPNQAHGTPPAVNSGSTTHMGHRPELAPARASSSGICPCRPRRPRTRAIYVSLAPLRECERTFTRLWHELRRTRARGRSECDVSRPRAPPRHEPGDAVRQPEPSLTPSATRGITSPRRARPCR
jgi:hypothetical protein